MVSASELARMGVCERLILFEAVYGKRTSRSQQEVIERGRAEHSRFFRTGVRSQPETRTSLAKPWCFCASLAWGPDAHETAMLRRFRDHVLRRSAKGRRLIWLYYRTAPWLCRRLEGHALLIRVLRGALVPVLWIATVVLMNQEGKRPQ